MHAWKTRMSVPALHRPVSGTTYRRYDAMRRWALAAVLPLVAVLLELAVPALAQERVSVEQLEGILAQAHNTPDADLAARLSDLLLTERLSTVRLTRLKAGVAGAKSQRA